MALWRGEIQLVETYWVYGVLGNFLLSIPLILLAQHAVESRGVAILVLMYAGFAIAYYAFTVVAIWRAASNYRGSVWWAALAKLVVILSALRLVGEMCATRGL